MTPAYDLIVAGAGPAGSAAALEAAALGLSVLLLDEERAAGGQIDRPASASILAAPASADSRRADRLRALVAGAGLAARFGERIWHLQREPDGYRVASVGPAGALVARAPALVLATGAEERVYPVPGWTLPGVTGLAAATVLLKAHRLLPGARCVVAGVGPLLPLVAAGILKAGGRVAALVDLASRGEWLALAPRLLTRPGVLARGATWAARLRAARVPLFHRATLTHIAGGDRVERVAIAPVDDAWRPRAGREWAVEADAVCLGHGLQPSTAASQLLRAAHRYDPALGGWVVRTDADQATGLPRLYACGDGAGVRGAEAAALGGRIAALAAARDLGRLAPPAFARRALPLQRRWARAARLGTALTALTAPRPGLIDLITPTTVVCRCEDLPRATLDAEIDAGAHSPAGLRAATRCGMGPCGGRFCAEPVAALLAARTGRPRTQVAPPTGRPPLRPVGLDELCGRFTYDDLPIPEPAPL
jgi:thioredoxin reductase